MKTPCLARQIERRRRVGSQRLDDLLDLLGDQRRCPISASDGSISLPSAPVAFATLSATDSASAPRPTEPSNGPSARCAAAAARPRGESATRHRIVIDKQYADPDARVAAKADMRLACPAKEFEAHRGRRTRRDRRRDRCRRTIVTRMSFALRTGIDQRLRNGLADSRRDVNDSPRSGPDPPTQVRVVSGKRNTT